MSVPLPSTFMPLPLAIMIPFMGMQSMVMAKQFGEGFQYGKRRISAMSNEEFNKLTMGQLMQQTNDELKTLIPNMRDALQSMRPFQREIFIEMLAAMKEAIRLGLDVVGAGIGIDTSLPSTEHQFLSPEQKQQHAEHGHYQQVGLPKPGPTKITQPRRPPSPPKPLFEQPKIPTPVRKRQAGPRQISIRNQLIRNIAGLGQTAKAQLTQPKISAQQKKRTRTLLLRTQQQLVNLLNKYIF